MINLITFLNQLKAPFEMLRKPSRNGESIKFTVEITANKASRRESEERWSVCASAT